MATANVPQVPVLVVVDAESPVGLHGGEAVVTGLQGVNPDATWVHAAEQQLSVGATKHQHDRSAGQVKVTQVKFQF